MLGNDKETVKQKVQKAMQGKKVEGVLKQGEVTGTLARRRTLHQKTRTRSRLGSLRIQEVWLYRYTVTRK